jgi:monoamine oxidase
MNGPLMTRRRLLAASALVPATPALGQGTRPSPAEVDVVVIGAGAAGIAAARKLTAAGRTVMVLEAKDRAGGRCIADTVNFGMPMDLGAHWIHAPEDNPLVPLARASGFQLYDDPERARLLVKGRRPREGEWEAYASALTRAQRAILDAGEAGREISLAAAMPTNLRDWQATVAFLKGAWDSGKEIADISCVDFYNAIETRDLFCRQSYGAILAKLAEGLPIRLSTAVTRVDWSGRGVAVETPAGTIRARAAVVTASTAVLAAGVIRFTPALPKRQADAIAALTCGAYEHLIVQLPAIRWTRDPTNPSSSRPIPQPPPSRSPGSAARTGGTSMSAATSPVTSRRAARPP